AEPAAPTAQAPGAPGDTGMDQFRSNIQRIRAGQPADGAAAAPTAQDAQAGSQDMSAVLQQSREHLKLMDQRVATLVQAFLDSGLAAMKAGNLKQAHDDFANAYELDPD